jgi:hemolysin III
MPLPMTAAPSKHSLPQSAGPAPQRYTRREETANALTHGLGWALSIAGMAYAVTVAARAGDAWVVTSVAVYGTTLIALYAISTVYHSVSSDRARILFRKLDHAAIFLLIAGTYTPFALVNLRGPWGWSLFGFVWGVALVGIAFKIFFAGRFIVLSSIAYVILGWTVLIALKPVTAALTPLGLNLLFAGGFCYTGGVVFYLWRRLPYQHAVWHVFVLAGSICHYFSVVDSTLRS